jgi:hypothetical protein
MNKIYFLLSLFLSCLSSSAQEAQMADTFRSEGKIYVVISVLTIVFVSVLIILLYMERRLTKLEKEIKEPLS